MDLPLESDLRLGFITTMGSPDAVRTTVQAAERLGYDSLWVAGWWLSGLHFCRIVRRRCKTLINLDSCVTNVLKPCLAVLVQTATQQPSDGGWDIPRQPLPIRLRLEDRSQCVGYGRTLEQPLSRQHFIEDNAERPHIGTMVCH